MKNIRKKLVIFTLVSIVIIIACTPFLFLFTPSKICDYFYRELTYKHVASTLDNNSRDNLETFNNLFKYVKENQNTDPSYKVLDSTAYNNLLLKVCWCDQQAFTLATLLNKSGINSRYRDVQNHTTLEVYINSEWKLADPFYGQLFYRKSDGQLATINDVVNNHGENLTANKFKIDKPFLEETENILPSNLYLPSEVRWPNGIGPEFSKVFKESIIRNLIANIADFSYDLLGAKYAFWFQDKYLMKTQIADIGPEIIIDYDNSFSRNDQSYRLYYNARNYHLYGRNDKAQTYFDRLISLYPESFWAKRAASTEKIEGPVTFSFKKIITFNKIFNISLLH
ncbi:MAG TPA: hypothetical protein VIO64_09870 [Pseudobacteroides sp.]|uniref:hypothetical protein n=1 Tax=Pseudobacteroides sp. TaxID=1968840 RepID=UPI002F934FC8